MKVLDFTFERFYTIYPNVYHVPVLMNIKDAPIAAALRSGNRMLVEPLLKRAGANINQQDFSGKTLLHYVVESGLIRLVPLLLENGANPNIEDKRGRTAANLFMTNLGSHYWGGDSNRREALKSLLEAGAKLDTQSINLGVTDSVYRPLLSRNISINFKSATSVLPELVDDWIKGGPDSFFSDAGIQQYVQGFDFLIKSGARMTSPIAQKIEAIVGKKHPFARKIRDIQFKQSKEI